MDETLLVHDPLGEALHVLRMQGTFYSRCVFSAPWGLALPPIPDSLMFHVVTTGHCWLEVDGEEPQLLQPGAFGLVPHGEGHRLTSTPGIAAAALADVPRELEGERYEVIQHGGGGASTGLVCGTVTFNHPVARRLVELLPRVISIESDGEHQQEWMLSTLRLMASEARLMRPGGETIITRLADVLVIQAIRAWIERDAAAQTGWLGALKDPQVGRALALIHRDPAQAWTVASLAAAVAMSRSAFAGRFTKLVGETPMSYLTRWRMQLAQTLLTDDGPTLADLAHQLGYHSEAAFSRAFKRTIGVSPGAVRRAT